MEKPLSWSDTDSSVLRLNIRHLCFFATWPLSESRIYHAYSVFIFIMMAWNTVENVLALCFIIGDLDETTLLLTYSITNCSGVVKMVLLVLDRQKYYGLARAVDSLMQSGRKDPALAGVLEDHRRRGARLTVCMLVFMASQGLLWYPMPLIVHPEERRLPFSQHGWDNNTHYYGVSYAVQCTVGMWLSQNSFGADSFFATIMILITAQFKNLITSIEGLRLPARHSDAKKTCSPSVRAIPEDHDKMYKDLCNEIRVHQNILRCINDLQSVMSPVAMTQFAGSVLLVCCTLFQATYSNDISAVIKCAAFLPISGGQVFLYCWAAHNISDQAEAVSLAAYSCSWLEADQRLKRALHVVISRARKPLVLTAGRLYPIDKPGFLSMVNASYSFYALLSQMNGR